MPQYFIALNIGKLRSEMYHYLLITELLARMSYTKYNHMKFKTKVHQIKY
jgi:hypothetical protein